MNFRLTNDIEKNVTLCGSVLRNRVNDLMTPNSKTARMLKTMEFLTVEDIDTVETLVDKAQLALANAADQLRAFESFFDEKHTAFINK